MAAWLVGWRFICPRAAPKAAPISAGLGPLLCTRVGGMIRGLLRVDRAGLTAPPITSGHPSTSDILDARQHVAKVPLADYRNMSRYGRLLSARKCSPQGSC
jgi:hypothetical protein